MCSKYASIPVKIFLLQISYLLAYSYGHKKLSTKAQPRESTKSCNVSILSIPTPLAYNWQQKGREKKKKKKKIVLMFVLCKVRVVLAVFSFFK